MYSSRTVHAQFIYSNWYSSNHLQCNQRSRVNPSESLSANPCSNIPRAENAIWFVKERLRSIQSETPFTKYPRRLTIKSTKRATILINSFRKKAGVYSVMSPRQILFRKKFKTSLCKMGGTSVGL